MISIALSKSIRLKFILLVKRFLTTRGILLVSCFFKKNKFIIILNYIILNVVIMSIKILLFVFLLSFKTFGQLNYSFTAIPGVYVPNSSPTTIHGRSVDNALSNPINIGFNFVSWKLN